MDPAVKAYFQKITSQGGKARAKKLSPERRKEIAQRAAKASARARSETAKLRKMAEDLVASGKEFERKNKRRHKKIEKLLAQAKGK